ncbi:MAG: phenylalanine--tRNA ligase subunit alpha [Proteobacteria bacterium]|nr:phenylalanine--tRNA ligase subunit alpha [Pseudomonadota bacterium]
MDLEELESLRKQAKERIEKINNEREWIDTKAYYLGKKGIIPSLLSKLPKLTQEEKKIYGQSVNTLKVFIEELLEQQLKTIKEREIEKKLSQTTIDITLPGKFEIRSGTVHPISQVIDEIIDIFTGMGFEVAEGPELESDYYNFEALNIPEEHPAREMQDTFYISDGFLLRTHTSPVQIRVMEKREPPLHVICPGKVYRRDSDITHSPMFHQVEGFVVDRDIHFGHLKGVLTEFLRRLYGENIGVRFRPSYFPFTEPSAEVDIQCVVCNGKGCRVCKNSGWLEVLGCGMIHPYLFSVVGYDKEIYSGFAFGLGVERLTMLKYAIDDIRLFYENNLSFLEQF